MRKVKFPRWLRAETIARHSFIFQHTDTPDTMLCLKARGGDVEVGDLCSQEYVFSLTDNPADVLIIAEVAESAEIIPFPNAVADVLERYAQLARAGAITGVVIAALTPQGLEAEPFLTHIGVNERELSVLLADLNDARLLALTDE